VRLVPPAAQFVAPPPVVSIADAIAIAAAVRPAQTTAVVKDTSSALPTPAQAILSPRFDAAYLHNPAPKYPLESRRLREQGSVLLRVEVSPAGSALEVLIEHTSGWRLLDDAAVAAVKRWRFVPARRGEDPIEAWVLVPVDFELSG
ncbi:MAG: energy transducer TonB, partial [Solirubrobacteraceae bacterium]